jgi:2-hydroxycyclohexanecarboxyl-CoA dehydrogenase
MSELTRLDGKVAIVTGGAGGIGQAIGRLLATRGASVVLTDKDSAVVGLADEFGPDAMGLIHDVSSIEESRAAIAQVRERHGRLDILINNAGWDRPGLFADSDPDDWLRIVQINYLGVVNGSHAALPLLREAPEGGVIVSIASDTARVGGWGEAVYAGAKAAVVAFSKSLAREVARDRIRVNCVSPAVTQTGFQDRLASDPVGAKVVEGAIRATPMRRAAVPEEIAEAVAFMSSPAAGFITGQVLSVNGGVVM